MMVVIAIVVILISFIIVYTLDQQRDNRTGDNIRLIDQNKNSTRKINATASNLESEVDTCIQELQPCDISTVSGAMCCCDLVCTEACTNFYFNNGDDLCITFRCLAPIMIASET